MGNSPGKPFERKDLRARGGSIAWSFRYNTLKKKDEPTMMVFNSQMNIREWLYLLNLEQYGVHFRNYTGVEELSDLNERDLKKIGISDCGHRSKMISSLVGVKAKRRQSMNFEENKSTSNILIRRKNSCPPIYIANLGNAAERLFPKTPVQVHCNEKQSFVDEIPPEGRDSVYEALNTGKVYQNPNERDSVNEMETSLSTSSSEVQEAIALKKALEWELSLDSRDLRSHAWYHGPLPRQRAEEIVEKEGDFLIRDCASQPDNFVLTCKTKTAILHFVINKILLQPETVYERTQYQFEEDAFDAVPDLITSYVGSGKPISAASGARIQYPCNRTYPLSFYGHKIVGNQLHTQMLAGIRGTSPLNSPSLISPGFRFTPYNPQNNNNKSPVSSPPRSKRDVPPKLPSKKQRSQSLTPAQSVPASNIAKNVETSSSADGVIHLSRERKTSPDSKRLASVENSTTNEISQTSMANQCNGFQTIARSTISEVVEHTKFTTHSLPRPNVGLRLSSIKGQKKIRDSSEITLSPFLESHNIPELSEKSKSPPPKPNRVPALPRREKELSSNDQHALHRIGSYHTSGSDSGNGSGDSVQSSTQGDLGDSIQHRGVIIKNPRFLPNSASSVTLKSLTEFEVAEAEDELHSMEIPAVERVSKFDIENFSTLLLPSIENKPLDGDALSTFKMMLLESGPKILAEHLTRIDINLIIEEELQAEGNSMNILQCCGLELLTLPHGKGFREDLLERTQCLKLMVAVTILTGQTDLDRAEILSKWIQVAVDMKTALGNLFGFSAIMLGLCMPQIQQLDSAWHILRQKFTDSAFTFEAKLRPTLKNMNECSNPQAPNTTVPHILLYILLKDRIIEEMIDTSTETKSSLVATCIAPWENKADDFGVSINFLHLDSARGFVRNLDLFRKNSKVVMEESSSRLDELLSDAFRTEFHVKFLWGSKGALASPEDRHSKLEKIQQLDSAWHILRQKFTDSAFTFKAKLRPTLKNMNECSNPQAPNTTVPHILLYILLKDRIIEEMVDTSTETQSSLVATCIAPWENKADDFGVSVNFLHLDSARGFVRNLDLFRKNSKVVMEESSSRLDELLSDAFRTEFHVKFLWGTKGALASPEDRHSKLEKVLSLMANKFCSTVSTTSTL